MTFVTGYNLSQFNRRKDGSSFRDWASETFEASLEISSLDRRDIDTLIVSSESDFFTGSNPNQFLFENKVIKPGQPRQNQSNPKTSPSPGRVFPQS